MDGSPVGADGCIRGDLRLQWSCVRWLLLRPGQMPDIAVVVERYRGAFNAIRPVAAVLPEMQRAAYEASLQDWKEKGLSQTLAQQLSELCFLGQVFDMIELAHMSKLHPWRFPRCISVWVLHWGCPGCLHTLMHWK